MEKSHLGRTTKFVITVFALVLLGLLLLLIYPITAVTSPTILQLQQNVRNGVDAIGPYLIVGLLGGTVGIAELASTFQTYPREALLTKWAWVLIFVNVVAAILALMVLKATTPQMNELLQILGVGVGFQALIRTKFILAKQVGGSGESEVSVNLGWLYDQFQNMARTQIDLELMNRRRTAVTRLTTYYPTLAELYDVAWYTITARATLTSQEEEAKLRELDRLLEPSAPENYAKSSLALMILENGGAAYVDLLLDQAMHGFETAVSSETLSTEEAVHQLVSQNSLDDLVALTKKATNDSKVIEYVENTAQSTTGISAETQKATIAQFILQNIGPNIVQQD